MNDAEIREVVNELRDIAKNFSHTQQLREMISSYIVPILQAARTDVPETDLFGEVPTAAVPEFISMEGLRAALLEPRDIVRDAEGWLTHPALPVCDEGTRLDKLLEAFGIEPAFVSMEFEDEALYDKWCEEGLSDCSSWTPMPPAGDGWLLLEIYMTEDGVCALFGRDWYVAEKERKEALNAERRAERIALRDQSKEQS